MRFAGSLQVDDLQMRPHPFLVGPADPIRFLGSMLGSRSRRPVGSAGAGRTRRPLVSGAELRVSMWVPWLNQVPIGKARANYDGCWLLDASWLYYIGSDDVRPGRDDEEGGKAAATITREKQKINRGKTGLGRR